MKRVKLTKQERKEKRKEYLQWWKGLTNEEKTKQIKENKAKHAKILEKKEVEKQAFKDRMKAGIAAFKATNALMFQASCQVYFVKTPAKRDKKTNEIIIPAVLEAERNKNFNVSLGVRMIEKVKGKNLQRLHVAFTIRSSKDIENAKIAKMHLGERMKRNAAFSFEFNSPVGPKSEGIDPWILEDLCWIEFNSYLRRPDTNLSVRFMRSWIQEGIPL